MCLGIFLVGIVLECARGFPKFQPFAMLGGSLWCTGNIMSVPTIQCMGMSLGLLVWGATNMLFGWASGRFGLFGLTEDVISDGELNFLGVGVAVFALGLYIFIEPTKMERETMVGGSRAGSVSGKPLLSIEKDVEENSLEGILSTPAAETWVQKLSPPQQRMAGVLMALVMGCFFGNSFNPAQYIMDTSSDYTKEDPADPLDFVFSHLCGIFISSTFYLAVYTLYCGGWGRTSRIPEVRVPALVCGIMWAVAQVSWFVANGALGFSVAFPLITSGPGFVAAMLGVFKYGEISGKRNYFVLAAAFACTVTANFFIVESKG